MKLIFLAHPAFLDSQSMPRYARMLSDAMKRKGHDVETWSPEPYFYKLKAPSALKKWLGYIDQYILFPVKMKKLVKNTPKKTLFVFTDHALGPWVPIVKNRSHVIHCHDFLAQFSASGNIHENRTGFTGKLYQSYIKRGYSQGRNFISISRKTEQDLRFFLSGKKAVSNVVYNGLNQTYEKLDPEQARKNLAEKIHIDLSKGYILHVGGNQWYKNRPGIIEIYNAYRIDSTEDIPLLLVGQQPSAGIKNMYNQSPFKNDIYFLTDMNDADVRLAYAGASVFLFPSFSEGFGWPIAEAMASGCLVITTDEAPMTEVAGGAAFLIPRRPVNAEEIQQWALKAAGVLSKALTLKPHERQLCINEGLLNVKRFSPETAIDAIEKIYKTIS